MKLIVLNPHHRSKPHLEIIDIKKGADIPLFLAIIGQYHAGVWTDEPIDKDLRFYVGKNRLVAFVPNFFQS